MLITSFLKTVNQESTFLILSMELQCSLDLLWPVCFHFH